MFLAVVISFFTGAALISWWRTRRGRQGHVDTRQMAIRQGDAVGRSRSMLQNRGAPF